MEHERTHSSERPYPCIFCDKRFGEKGAANKHELIHRDEKHYGCNFCDKKFIQSSNAKKHEMIHMNKNIKMYLLS